MPTAGGNACETSGLPGGSLLVTGTRLWGPLSVLPPTVQPVYVCRPGETKLSRVLAGPGRTGTNTCSHSHP